MINTSAITADKLYCVYHFLKMTDFITFVFSNKITNKSVITPTERKNDTIK